MTTTMRAEAALDRSARGHELPPAVSATDVTRRYGRDNSAGDALAGVSIDVPVGPFTAVMGPSGSGKLTLMHILAGLDQPHRPSDDVSCTSRDVQEPGGRERERDAGPTRQPSPGRRPRGAESAA